MSSTGGGGAEPEVAIDVHTRILWRPFEKGPFDCVDE